MVETKPRAPELTDDLIEDFVRCCKLLSDSTRLRIMLILGTRGECHVSGLCRELKLNQPAVSHHLSILKDSGVVELRREGKHNFYAVIHQPFCDAVKNLVSGLTNGSNIFQYDGLSVNVRV